jgi:hypothetical protein
MKAMINRRTYDTEEARAGNHPPVRPRGAGVVRENPVARLSPGLRPG